MSRIHFDASCNTCGPVVILEGNPMLCPSCGERIEVLPIKLDHEYFKLVSKEGQPTPPDTQPTGKEIRRG